MHFILLKLTELQPTHHFRPNFICITCVTPTPRNRSSFARPNFLWVTFVATPITRNRSIFAEPKGN